MKKIIILALAVLTLGVSTTLKASWFHDDSENEKLRRIEVQHALEGQKKQTDQWQGVAFALGIGCVLTLLTGTIIGSRTRRHAKTTDA